MTDRENKFHRVSGRQLELLWEYLNSNRNIVSAYNRSLEAKEYAATKWNEVADHLNSLEEGAYKDWRAWSKYWVDYKAKLKKKAAFLVSNQNKTGSVTPTQPLSIMDFKFLQLLGEDFVQGLSGVRVKPFPQLFVTTEMGSTQSSPCSESILDPLQEQWTQCPERTSIQSPTPTPPPQTVISTRTLGRSRRRRKRPMTQEAARRALVQSSQLRAKAAMRSSHALEMIQQGIAEINQRLSNMENTLQKVVKGDK